MGLGNVQKILVALTVIPTAIQGGITGLVWFSVSYEPMMVKQGFSKGASAGKLCQVQLFTAIILRFCWFCFTVFLQSRNKPENQIMRN